MIHASFSELRRRLAHYMDRAVDDRAPVLVTRQGHEPVVMLAQSEYDGIMERLAREGVPKKPLLGAFKGQIALDDSFFDPLPDDELALWNGEGD